MTTWQSTDRRVVVARDEDGVRITVHDQGTVVLSPGQWQEVALHGVGAGTAAAGSKAASGRHQPRVGRRGRLSYRGRRWSAHDSARLAGYYRDGLPIEAMALLLGRTARGIEARLARQGLSPRTPRLSRLIRRLWRAKQGE
ncbi:hypothetical protein [Sphingomicrobium astaxanthinifaciens]|uniref:hypothetical protein n=1 Tax=Sphingomicrobium astaxanthinifaciens TaxID=1227949 RepID=UPI001FCC5FB2|nr:hypothetical protein [Sphingomicrobium astaxanthinifaciens]MCJ7421121.1 hypothetical protein [Sphingomicrobium astaxanthinifaciens]